MRTARLRGVGVLAGLGLMFEFGLWWVGPRVALGAGYHILYWLMVAIAALSILFLPPGLRGFRWRDGPGGWRVAGSAYAGFTAAAAALILLALLAFAPARFAEVDWEAVAVKFAGYLVLGFIQAVVFFSFLLTRLRLLLVGPRRRWHVAAAVAVIFALAHLPNLPLTALTLVAGFGWSIIYYRRPNVWLLTLSHAVLGTLLHQVAGLYMRIGPFYHDPELFILRAVVPGLAEFIGGRF